MAILVYEKLEIVDYDPRIKDCCIPKDKPKDDPSCDCCYDQWKKELKQVTREYNSSEKQVEHLTAQLAYVTDLRDTWKKWTDELNNAGEYAKKICNQLRLMLHHLHQISKNVKWTVDAIDILYCMIRDFYMQLDLLKTKYDYLINCINCIGNPALGTGLGIRVFIDDYGKKLDAVIATRDKMITALAAIINVADHLHCNLSHEYGLKMVLNEWRKAFNCDEKCYVEEDRYRPRDTKNQGAEGEYENIGLHPTIRFPICNNDYYDTVYKWYEEERKDVNNISSALYDATKRRDALKACKTSLEAAMKEVNPQGRCN